MSPFPIEKKKSHRSAKGGKKRDRTLSKKGGSGGDEVGRKTALSTFKTPSRSFFPPPTEKRGGGALSGGGGGRMKEGEDGWLTLPRSHTRTHQKKRRGRDSV